MVVDPHYRRNTRAAKSGATERYLQQSGATREDEYSYILEGRTGAQLGEETLEASPGDLVFKPRNQWHTFWNAGDEPCRVLEIIAPAGFEDSVSAPARKTEATVALTGDPATSGALRGL